MRACVCAVCSVNGPSRVTRRLLAKTERVSVFLEARRLSARATAFACASVRVVLASALPPELAGISADAREMIWLWPG